MSLNRAEMARTSVEMRRHLEASGVSADEIGVWVGLPATTVEAVMAMNGAASPSDTWLVRDALTLAVADAGRDAGGWTVLTENARRQAEQWFTLRRVPPRPGASAG